MLLIFPPAAKPSEPPAGIAKLAGALRGAGLPCTLLDANIEGLLSLLSIPPTGEDTWTRRAGNNRGRNIAALRDPLTYRSPGRYRRSVTDLNRVLAMHSREKIAALGLTDYHDQELSPLRSADLIYAAEHPDGNIFFPYFSKRIPEILEAADTDLGKDGIRRRYVGFSLNYLSQALCAFAIIGFIKKEFPGAAIVLGGGLITSWMTRPGWTNPFAGLADILIPGPGEKSLLEMFGAVTGSGPRPDYSALPVREYLSPGLILPYSASTGCYWNQCSFCPEKAEGNPYHALPPHRAAQEVKDLRAATDAVLIHFLDNALSPAMLHALVETPPNAPWYGFARIGRELLDLDFCIALKQAGCSLLKLGLESGDQGVLDRLHKGIDLETVEHVLANLKRAGIATYIYLLFGTPAETIEEARTTLSFTIRHCDEIDYLNLAVFNMPLAGEEAEEHATKTFYDGDLSLYTAFRHPGGWDRKEVRRFLEQEFKRSPAIAAILRNDPPLFTSNHAPLFEIMKKTIPGTETPWLLERRYSRRNSRSAIW